jgi:hypothetical protein
MHSAASSVRGLRFEGGRHFTTFAISMSRSVSIPTALMILSKS